MLFYSAFFKSFDQYRKYNSNFYTFTSTVHIKLNFIHSSLKYKCFETFILKKFFKIKPSLEIFFLTLSDECKKSLFVKRFLYIQFGLGKVPLMKRSFSKLTEEPFNERQKPLIFKALTKWVRRFEVKKGWKRQRNWLLLNKKIKNR